MKVKKPTKTAYGVYIIESLRSGDFKDGRNLHQILDLSNIVTVYNEVTSTEHFKDLLADFIRSGIRYLHLSCHADRTGFEIAGEEVKNAELSKLLNGGLSGYSGLC